MKYLWLLAFAGCGFLQTPEGQKAATDTVDGAVGVLTNPLNPIAWGKLIASGAGLAAGALGLYHSPKGVKAAGRAAKAIGGAVKRRFTKKPAEAKPA